MVSRYQPPPQPSGRVIVWLPGERLDFPIDWLPAALNWVRQAIEQGQDRAKREGQS